MPGSGLDQREQRVVDLIARESGKAESVVAVLAVCQVGPSPRLTAFLSPVLVLFSRLYAVAVTDSLVYIVRRSWWTGRPKAIESTASRDAVTVLAYSPGRIWSTLRLAAPAFGELKFDVPWRRNHEAAAVAHALRFAAS